MIFYTTGLCEKLLKRPDFWPKNGQNFLAKNWPKTGQRPKKLAKTAKKLAKTGLATSKNPFLAKNWPPSNPIKTRVLGTFGQLASTFLLKFEI